MKNLVQRAFFITSCPCRMYRHAQEKTQAIYSHHDNTSLMAEKQILLMRLIEIELEQERRRQEYQQLLKQMGW